MGRPKLYYSKNSPASRTALITAKAINLDVELIDISTLENSTKNEAFIKINPQHTVPTLDDNGDIVVDSHAIATYLVSKYAKPEQRSLCPTDPYQRAKVDHLLHFENGTLFARLIKLILPLFHGTATKFDEDSLKSALEAMDIVEIFLKNGTYLAGNNLTVADFSCISTVTMAHLILKLEPANYPLTTSWIARLSKEPFYNEFVTSYLDHLRTTFMEKLKATA